MHAFMTSGMLVLPAVLGKCYRGFTVLWQGCFAIFSGWLKIMVPSDIERALVHGTMEGVRFGLKKCVGDEGGKMWFMLSAMLDTFGIFCLGIIFGPQFYTRSPLPVGLCQ